MRLGFIFPSKNVGGAQLLFARLSNEISKRNPDVSVFYIDYQDGFSAKWLEEETSKVKLIVFSDDMSISLPIDITWILPFEVVSVKRCKNNLSFKSAKFIFWFIHPNLLLSFFRSTQLSYFLGLKITKILTRVFFRRRFKFINRFLLNSAENSGLIYMDGENTKVPFFYYPELDAISKIIPVPIFEKRRRIKTKQDSINLAWVGRLSSEKKGALCNLLKDIDAMIRLDNKNVIFHIVGDGSHYNLIKSFSSRLNFAVVFHNTFVDSQLDSFLRNRIDILFAMGTSALEGASMGLPTILLDAINREMNGKYRYGWIFNTQNYSLGGRTANHNNTMSMNEVIETLDSQNIIDNISHRCYEYSKFHSFDDVVKSLMSTIDNCTNLLENSDFP